MADSESITSSTDQGDSASVYYGANSQPSVPYSLTTRNTTKRKSTQAELSFGNSALGIKRVTPSGSGVTSRASSRTSSAAPESRTALRDHDDNTTISIAPEDHVNDEDMIALLADSARPVDPNSSDDDVLENEPQLADSELRITGHIIGGISRSLRTGGSFGIQNNGLPARRARGKESWVWKHGERVMIKGVVCWQCRHCKNRDKPKTYSVLHGVSNCGKHIENDHNITAMGLVPLLSNTSVAQQQQDGAESIAFSAEGFRQRLLMWIAVAHIPFSVVENTEFRELMLYSSGPLRGMTPERTNDILPKSHSSIQKWLVELFLVSQAILIAFLAESEVLVHISFDLWTAPNGYNFLGIVCHYTDNNYEVRTILLGLQRLYGPHSGANIAKLLIETLTTYRLSHRLGFCVMDNAADNDTALSAVQDHLIALGIVWSADAHRLRCFGHVVNLIVGAFLANKPLKIDRKPRASKSGPKPAPEAKIKWSRPVDAISWLHTIIVFIMVTNQRVQEFLALACITGDKLIRPVKEQATRWFSTYAMLVRAIELRSSITLFALAHKTSPKGEKNLKNEQLEATDWNYIAEVNAFMKPFRDLTLSLEGKDREGNNGGVWQVLPAYDMMRDHVEQALEQATHILPDADDSNDELDSIAQKQASERTRMHTNILNAQAKLEKYRQLLNSPVYVVACVLVPWSKWNYFKKTLVRSDLAIAKSKVQSFYDTNYAELGVVNPHTDTSVFTAQQSTDEMGMLKSYFLATGVSSSSEFIDEYEQYCQSPIEYQGKWKSPLHWWSEHATEFPQLARMARDIFSIPGMSAEVERLFSSAKLMLPPARSSLEPESVQAGECLRSWRISNII